MPSVLAIVSKKIFERDFGGAAVGEVVATARYASSHKTLDKLADGGDLFLVTVAANEQLLLAGVLRKPTFGNGGWTASAPNTVPIRDITSLVGRLKFDTGHGITAKPGTLAMSLQTPRGLTADDVALLDASAPPPPRSKPGKPSKVAKAAPPPVKSTPAPRPQPIASGTDPDLARAHTDLAADRLVPALDALLRAWARCRSSEVGDLIDRLGAAIARSLPAIVGNKKTIDAAWRDVGDQLRPADVPRLAVALDLGSAPQAEGWLDILLRFPIDPRLCAPAIDMSLKFVSSTAGPTRTRAFKLAGAIADGRCLTQIAKLKASRRDAWNWTELKDRLTKLASKFAEPPPLPSSDAAAVDAIATQIARIAKQPAVPEAKLFAKITVVRSDGELLLAQVLEDPHNDAARLVYFDYLQERDDPRGELIALQAQRRTGTLTHTQEDRESALVRDPDNLKKWLGPLIAVVSEPVFDRGFLTSCTVDLKSAKQRAELVAHPYWATVEKLRCSDVALVESPAMRSLEHVSGLSHDGLAKLARDATPVRFHSLSDVELRDAKADVPMWTTLLDSPAFAKLRHFGPFEMRYGSSDAIKAKVDGWTWLLDSRCGTQLRSLTLHFGYAKPPIGAWFEWWTSRNQLERLELQTGGYNKEGNEVSRSYAFTRVDGAIARISIWFRHPVSIDEDELTPDLLAGVTGVPELVVELTRPTKHVRDRIAALARAAYGRKFPTVTVRDAR